MNQIKKIHQEWILVAAALVILGVLVGFFIWNTTVIAVNVERAISPEGTDKTEVKFDLDGAKKLNLLIQR